ncbi:nucleoside recognition domain-containing protein [Tissierella sp. MB52-C2]|uniref:YjiH family protein n=1 Tax=Tissierella sp. MB52-C2 TaxID=3070999 RepID=UPI00280AE4AB|nr:nucleoside recognition domain-containing protein [Tissierella sp. MB52-C2]WMM24961.1 nucleoside recognition domain-containing protein [Tissierella sp. MB52-C2]
MDLLTPKEIKEKDLDLNDLSILDSFSLSKADHTKGLIKSIFFSLIAVFIFFIPITFNGKTDMVFGIMYGKMMELTGNLGLWIVTLVVLGTGLLSSYGKYIAKSGRIHDYFEGDSKVHPILYLLGGFYVLAYTLNATMGVQLPEIIVGSSTGGTIVPAIVVAVFWIIIVSSVTMPFLLNYGIVDFVGSLLEPLMRPVWKVPGRAAVNAIASFVSSSSVGVLITSKLYKQGVYTEKEAVLVVTGFSAVSVGFAYMVIETAGLADRFLLVYFSSLMLTLVVSAIMARIPPFSKKKDVYINGKIQTKEDIINAKPTNNLLTAGITRASKKALTAPSLGKEILVSLKEGFEVLPKVLSLLAAVGVSSLIIAETTPVFVILGKAFEPLLNLLRVPNVELIAPSFPVGIAEMFLPVLLIKNNIALIDAGARYLVVAVSIVQIIFFAETIVVMMSSKLPLKLWELVVAFVERTFLAIIFGSILMHLFF